MTTVYIVVSSNGQLVGVYSTYASAYKARQKKPYYRIETKVLEH